jgi:hypothetical protein
MHIHCLCVVKNEADVIEQALRSAAKWSAAIYVLDNGSSDGTWERVQRLAEELPAVTPYKQDPRPFDDSIRGDILRHYMNRAKLDDWWCILDADEFYIDDPREFLAGVPKRFNAVWMQRYTYQFTEKDVATYREDPQRYDEIPIEQRLRHYVLGKYTYLRCFRHSDGYTRMPDETLRPICPRRIRIKHFTYRSPSQILRRFETRWEPMQRGEFLYEKRGNWLPGGGIVPGPAKPEDMPQSWEERVVSSNQCHLDVGDGVLVEASPWTPPTDPTWGARLRSRTRSVLRRSLRFVRRARP